ncbi:hypothetical protein NDU88_005992 [Pleurodeles waltl]|uniref:Uncharacterized protein n=1 Tax=Pleurodeles waltl TaxID=8319 RepID=A0AAV7SN97_PLEWA|nr:hypothetical protein NDU88_005992 [Pleurodeles waltl]
MPDGHSGNVSDCFLPEVNVGEDELELDYDWNDEWEDGEVYDVSEGCQLVAKGNKSGGTTVQAVGVLRKSRREAEVRHDKACLERGHVGIWLRNPRWTRQGGESGYGCKLVDQR